jgi:poly-gamma-glutamate capsule biosynthesis protein CapA/YwtB (metallophosphatase superfamily)
VRKNNFKTFVILSIVIFLCVLYVFVQRVFLAPDLPQSKLPDSIESFEFLQGEDDRIVLFFTGDVMLGRTVEMTARGKNDFLYPFRKVADVMQRADITFINLENPIITNCPPHSDGFTFCANPQMAEGLTLAGVDIVTLANNHTLNYGQKGIEETKEILNSKGIVTTGIGELVVIERRGTRFGFLGFEKSQQGNPKLTNNEKLLVRESNEKVDVLVVAMHWGVEYQDKPLPGVRLLAKEIVESGADVIVGSHPHWVQISEQIEGPDGVGRPVYYSLGNFIFDQMWSEPTKKGLAVRLTFEEKMITKEEFLPVYIRERGQPEWVEK